MKSHFNIIYKIKSYLIFTWIFTFSLISSSVFAFSFNSTSNLFENDFQTDQIRLWITKDNQTFVDWTQPADWVTDFQSDTFLGGSLTVGTQPDTPPALWDITFSGNGKITMEWEELLNGTRVGVGTLFRNPSGKWIAQNKFSNPPVPTPIPQTALLLASGVFGLVIIRRRRAY